MPGTVPRKSPAKPSGSPRGTGLLPLTVNRAELLVAGADREFRRFIYNLHSLSVRMDRLRDRISALTGLTGSQYHILMAIAELSGTQVLNVNAVADALRTSGAFITREAGALVREGLVRKIVKRDDRRHVILALTPRGRRVLNDVAPSLRRINDTLFAGVSADDFAGMRRFIGMMLDNMPATFINAEGLRPASRRRMR